MQQEQVLAFQVLVHNTFGVDVDLIYIQDAAARVSGGYEGLKALPDACSRPALGQSVPLPPPFSNYLRPSTRERPWALLP